MALLPLSVSIPNIHEHKRIKLRPVLLPAVQHEGFFPILPKLESDQARQTWHFLDYSRPLGPIQQRLPVSNKPTKP